MALTGAAYADAYTNVDFLGKVVSPDGNPIVSATVNVESEQGSKYNFTTGGDGAFRATQIPIGRYKVTVKAPGTAASTQWVYLSQGASSFDFVVEKRVASAASGGVETVVVSAVRTQDFTRTDIGLSINTQDMAKEIPIGRSINAAVLLAPSVVSADASIVANGVRRNQSAVTLGGTSAAESVYYINGLNVTDQRTFLGYADLPFDFIENVDTKTGGYSAEFGRATGGVINLTTRSGTNEWHFGADAYFTPNILRNTRGYANGPGGNNAAGQKIYNQFASAESSEQSVWVGGPLVKDHIFFFGTYNFRQSATWGAAGYTTPTDLANSSGVPQTNGTQTYSKDNSPRWATKFDFVLNEDHRIEFTMFSDLGETFYQPWNVRGHLNNKITAVTGLTNADGSLLNYTSKYGGVDKILKYTGKFADWISISLLYGNIKSTYKDFGPNIDMPGVSNGLSGANYSLGRAGGPFNQEGLDTRETYRADVDLYWNVLGEHHTRIGYDVEKMTSLAKSYYSGGAIYYYFPMANCPTGADANGCIEKLTYGNDGTFKAQQSAYYFNDDWQITQDLSVQIGVRNDLYNYKNVANVTYMKANNQWAPRLGFSWDPIGEGTDKFFGGVGDYYLPIALNTSIREVSGEVYTDQYYMTTASGGAPVLNAAGYPALGTQLGPTDYLSPPTAPDPRTVAMKDLAPMFERMFYLGYQHQWKTDAFGGAFDGVTTGVRYVHRKLMSTIEDTAIGDAVARWCIRTGKTCDDGAGDIVGAGPTADNSNAGLYYFSGNLPYVLINPGKAATVFIDPGDGGGIRYIDLTAADMNLPKAQRTYDAVEFTFERPFDGTWGLAGSYVWGDSMGNYEGAVKSDIGQTDTSITQDFDHSVNEDGGYGALPNARKHTFKIYGTYSPIENLTVGTVFTAVSGRQYGCLGYANGQAFSPISGTPSTWYCPNGAATSTPVTSLNAQLNYAHNTPWAQAMTANGTPGSLVQTQYYTHSTVLTKRGGAGKLPWTFNFDLNLGYTVKTESVGDIAFTLDVFNVFDADRATRVVEQGEVRTSASGQKGVQAPYWGMPRTYQAPRSMRFGIRYAF